MKDQFERTELLIGRERLEKLLASRVAVFGVGGVGSYVVEALARGGVGALDLIDNDTVALSNINRQLVASFRTIGQYKVDVAREHVLDVNPEAEVTVWKTFYTPETASQFDFSRYDYVVDAIDTVTGKLMLAEQAHAAGVPLISCMGAGNKMDPTAFRVADIYETSVCPLAKVMRRELKKRGITHLKVVYSQEIALTPLALSENIQELTQPAGDVCMAEEDAQPDGRVRRRQTPGSVSFVPSAAGLIIAGEVIKDLTGWKR